ncbi:uncharacterized protein PRCAT00003395001 [Priceomyces carsonii]|uniref:uncharacterized protein n=1 Tax=Priceomyces carsonii TaxID=28549 RepID=UPI002EDB8FDD|nr:unnamed protein product [Priceomyces carsonii]
MASNVPVIKFGIREITWSDYNFKTPILLQDQNGPCPLIALINTLLLKHEILNKNTVFDGLLFDDIQIAKVKNVESLKDFLRSRKQDGIELEEILARTGDLLLVFGNDKSSEFNVDKLLEGLPKLHTGLSVDPDLTNGTFPNGDISSQLFKIFELRLRHGWCIDEIKISSKDQNDIQLEVLRLLHDLKTFDKVQDFLLLDVNELNEPNEEEKQRIRRDQNLVNKWLKDNQSQLTTIGLGRLNSEMEAEQLVVFFRNNHFNSLFKKSDHEFYLLITDDSFRETPIVWQSLNSVKGNEDLFFDGEFCPIFDTNITAKESLDNDYLLMKKLQEEEDIHLAKKLQKNYHESEKENGKLLKKNISQKSSTSSQKETKKEKKLKWKWFK